MSRHAAVPYNPQPPFYPAIPLQICTFVFNNFQDAPPATAFFSNFCIVARGWVPFLSRMSSKFAPSTNHDFQRVTNRSRISPPVASFCFQALTHCPICNSFAFITLQQYPGVGTTATRDDLKFHFNSPAPRLLRASRGAIACCWRFYRRTGWSALFQVALPAVAVGHRHASAHEHCGGNQQKKDGFVDRALAALGAGLDIARTHRATLAESRRRHTQSAKKRQCGQQRAAQGRFRGSMFHESPITRTYFKTRYKGLNQ